MRKNFSEESFVRADQNWQKWMMEVLKENKELERQKKVLINECIELDKENHRLIEDAIVMADIIKRSYVSMQEEEFECDANCDNCCDDCKAECVAECEQCEEDTCDDCYKTQGQHEEEPCDCDECRAERKDITQPTIDDFLVFVSECFGVKDFVRNSSHPFNIQTKE